MDRFHFPRDNYYTNYNNTGVSNDDRMLLSRPLAAIELGCNIPPHRRNQGYFDSLERLAIFFFRVAGDGNKLNAIQIEWLTALKQLLDNRPFDFDDLPACKEFDTKFFELKSIVNP